MFENFKAKMEREGGNIREADRKQSVEIMEAGFDRSQSYRRVRVDGEYYDARVILDSKTTTRGGNGSYLIQFRDNFCPKAGTYVEIPDIHNEGYEMWLILYESNSTLFPKHIMQKCNYQLRWKNKKGDIVERWCVFADNSKLMDAESKTNFNKLTISRYSTSLLLPCDEETVNVHIDKRFLVDVKHTDGTPPDAWVVTNRNVISKTFSEYTGVIELMLARHQFNHLTDNPDEMIADYFATTYDDIKEFNEAALYDVRIVYNGTSDLKMGTPYKVYTAELYQNGELNNNIDLEWDILTVPEYESHFTYKVDEYDNHKLKIKCAFDGLLMGQHIRLIVKNEELGISAELPVKVVSSI